MATVEQLIRIVVVDDDPMVRTGLGLIVGGAADMEIIAEACDGVEALAAVRQHHPDIVLMDIRMPNMDGLAATREILSWPQHPAVIVLTTFDSDDFIFQALHAGAAGFLLKDTPPQRMVDAIRAAVAGEPTLSPSVISTVIAAATASGMDQRQAAARAELDQLAPREREVALAIAQGKSNAEIAASLYMSVATVKAYITRIFDKLGLDNRVQVAVKVHDAGLI